MSDPAMAAGWDPSRSAAGDRNPWLVAIVVSIATFMVVLDTAIANVSLRYIAASVDESTWVVTTYFFANAAVLPASGWLSNVIGRKRFYMICVALFTVSSLLCGLAPSLSALIFFRILQGLGGGGMPTSEQAILADTFPPQKRGQAFALYGVAVIVAPTVGPTIAVTTIGTAWWAASLSVNAHPSPASCATIARKGSRGRRKLRREAGAALANLSKRPLRHKAADERNERQAPDNSR
jgi:MFS family permease